MKQAAEGRQPLLFIFGSLDWLDGHARRRVSGQQLFDDLSSKGVWFCARPVHAEAGVPALFYLKKKGVLAIARIDSISPVQESDFPILSRLGLAGYYRTTFRISRVVQIDPPVDLKRLIGRLEFISNKGSHWGTSLRTTPRVISMGDFETIISATNVREIS